MVSLWASVSVFFIVIVETLRMVAVRNDKDNPREKSPVRKSTWMGVELCRHFGYFALGAVTTLLFGEVAKYQIGRLRPHYLSLCNPELTDDLCKDGNGYYKFVEENEETMCQDYEQNKKKLHEARLSFLSGHSSFSFYCGTFLIIYLQARLNKMPYIQRTPIRLCYRVLKVLRPFIQFAMIILSFWVSLTRISDYFHHPMDVVTGALVGVVFALVTLTIIADLFNKRSSFWKSFPSCDPSNDLSRQTTTATTEVALTDRTNTRPPEPKEF